MNLRATTMLAATPERVFVEIADLSTYPHWLGIVHRAEPILANCAELRAPDARNSAHFKTVGEDLAWSVELGARLGPFRRTKRVRMVRTVCEEPVAVRFERVEDDGRQHSSWVLRADLAPTAEGTELTMHLHYGGTTWLPGLDLVLGQEVRRAGARLAARLA